jgi:hypothetical protein
MGQGKASPALRLAKYSAMGGLRGAGAGLYSPAYARVEVEAFSCHQLLPQSIGKPMLEKKYHSVSPRILTFLRLSPSVNRDVRVPVNETF